MVMPLEALSLFEELKESRIFPNELLYDIVVDVLCKQGKVEDAKTCKVSIWV